MRRVSVAVILGCACLLASFVASAQDYTPSIRPSTFVPIDPLGTGVTTYDLSSVSAITNVPLPFEFVFYGKVFLHVNISRYGYVTFSGLPGTDEATGGNSLPTVSTNQYPLPNPTSPNGVIAAWWDFLYCPANGVKTRDAVLQGSRTFTIEWNGCYPSSSYTSASTQVQIRFTESSPVISVYYGTLGSGYSSWSATVGIENPPVWREEPGGGPTLVSAGGTTGVTPTLGATCAASGCNANAWPTNQVIQYGHPNAPDLQAGANPTTGRIGLQLLSLSGFGTITVELENNIGNAGAKAASPVTWDYYLSENDVLDPAVDTLLPCGHTTPENVPGLAVRSFVDICTITLPPGIHRICTMLDPPSESASEGAVVEAIEGNNSFCSSAFAVGADVSGSLTVPATAEAGNTMKVPVLIENRGTDPTPDFKIQIWLQNCNPTDTEKSLLAWETTISLQGAGPDGFWEEDVDVTIRPDVPGRSICATLVIDPGDTVPELDETNNTYSTCAPHDALPKACVDLARPDLRIDQLAISLPAGCFFGEPIEVTAQVCNHGPTEGRDFGLAFYLDTNSVTSIYDTLIASVPQACRVPADCIDLGGGSSVCIDGICQTPCLADADCGNGGLECEPSFVTEGKTCQLVLPGGKCRFVSVHTGIPTFDLRQNAPFGDGAIFFGSIVDWTEKVVELVDGNENTRSMDNATPCSTRKPDFAPVEVRAPSMLGSGEVMPVARRVRNLGPVSAAYTYRYVLSFNEAISVNDLSLEIVGVGLEGDSFADAWTNDAGHDLVRLPDGVSPGFYYLGIIVDSDNRVLELREDNNTARTGQLTVIDSSLRVATESLRTATVGAPHAVQLLAVGGEGAYTWSVTRGELPPGLRLEESGLLHGVATKQDTYLFEATVASGPNIASASFALEVAPARDPLVITLAELPPAFQGTAYSVLLRASGGLPPYRWSCPTKPSWLRVEDDFLNGTSAFVADPVAVVCSVTDANGSKISKNYVLAVFPASTFRIRSTDIAAEGGVELINACLTADGGSGSYHWSIDTAALPPGVGFENRSSAGCLTGTPSACGTYLVGVTVTDTNRGLTDARRLTVTVFCDDLRLTTRNLPVAERNAEYPVTQLATSAMNPVVFEVAGGELPLGLTLSTDGKISGLVAVDAQPGAHNLAVRFRDDFGRGGVGAVAIQVLPDPKPRVELTKTTAGCSASDEGPTTGLLPFAAIGVVAFLRRRSPTRPAMAGMVAAALLFPAVAAAQFTPGYATYHWPKDYEKLTTASPLDFGTLSNAAFPIALPRPFRFFGEDYESLWAHENGLILFGANDAATTPYPIPYVSSSTPRNFIAGWWDDHRLAGRPGSFLYAVRGQEPNRELVFEWNWLAAYSLADPLDGGEHQISLFENGDIAIRWGKIVDSGKSASTHLAVIGLMDALGSPRSVPFLSCSTYVSSTSAACKAGDWNNFLKDTEAVFTAHPNLQVRETATAAEGLSGLEQTFSVTLYNYGPSLTRAPVRFFVSTDETLSTDDVPVGTSDTINVGPFAEAQATLRTSLPRELAEGRYHLLALADPNDEVDEFMEDDNAGGGFEFLVVPPRPDLVVIGFRAPASAVRGSNITVDLAVRNLGNLDATDVPFSVVLSDNEVITASDFQVFQGMLSAGWLQTVETSVIATLPASTPPGAYWVGVVLDPEGLVSELDQINNTAIADRPFLVTVDGLVVTTLAPGTVQVGSEFCIPLQAEGGDGVYAWALVEGALPPGLDLSAGTIGASICGRTTAVGIFDFTLEVTSAGLTTHTQMTLEVAENTFELSIGARELPIAQIQVPYEAGLLAFGGTVPYTWEMVSGLLPAGVSFRQDGLVFGTPLQSGTFALEVRVTDAANRTVTEGVTLPIAPPPRLTCSSRTLGSLVLGESFKGKLFAAGGNGEYRWTTGSTVRYGDPGAIAIVATDPPPGLELGVTAGDVAGTPSQVGRYLWTLEVASGTETDTCAVAVDVVGGQGLTVTTTALPAAVPGREYRAQLKAIGGVGTLQWALAYGSDLPEGLILDPAGAIQGTPADTTLLGQESRTFGFRVEVRDSRNLKGASTLSVTLALETEGTKIVVERDEGGCQAAGGGFSLAALALVLVPLRRRR